VGDSGWFCNGDFDLKNIIDKTVNTINKFLDIDNQRLPCIQI
jgi:hypothetical protein